MFVNNIRNIKVISFLLLIAIAIYIFLVVKTNGISDDKYFSEALQNRSLWEFIKYRYERWSTRLTIETFLVLTINHKILYKLIITSCFLVTMLFMTKLASSGKQLNGIKVLLCTVLLLSIPHSVLDETLWWVSGAYNYFMPVAFTLPALYIYFFRDRFSFLVQLLSLLLMIVAYSSEQILICFVLPLIIIQTIKNKDFSFYNILFFLVSIGYTISAITSPGNKIRFLAEISYWFPDYTHFNYIGRLGLGLDRINENLANLNIPLLLLSVLVLCILIKRVDMKKVDIFSVVVIALYSIFSIGKFNKLPIVNYTLLDFSTSCKFKNFIHYSFTILFVFSLLFLVVSICRNAKDLLNTFVILILGFGSVMAVGFSPTIYASGARILFFLDLTFVYVVIYLLFSFFPVKKTELV